MGRPKHTPGPWIAASAPSSIVGWPIVGQQGRAICAITWPRGMPRQSLPEEFYQECVANAHLIGASPDLLEALLAACKHITQPLKMTRTEALYDARGYNALVDQMRKAIAKALGDAA